jgi:hypothetical protein
MSIAYATLDEAATSSYELAADQLLAEVSGQQPEDPSSYVGAHRRPGSQSRYPDGTELLSAHLPRHRRES